MAFTTDGAKQALGAAIAAVESASSIEVVAAVRPRVRRWFVPHVIAAAVAGIAMLAFVLYTEWEFDLWAILLLPIVVAAAAWTLVDVVPGLERALTPAATRSALLAADASAAFHTLGVHKTTGRTGLLVFIALRERRVVLLGDTAVVERVSAEALARIAATLESKIPAGGEAVARALADAAPELGRALPRAADDQDELPNLVSVAPPRRRFRGRAS